MKVLIAFTDDQDGNHVYNVGDQYPRAGLEPAEERVAYLASERNKLKAPVIEQPKEKKRRKEGVI